MKSAKPKIKNKEALKIGASFDVNQPYIPGGQDFKGVPNATPEMLRKLQQRKLKNPDGKEDLPGFLKKAEAQPKKRKPSYG